MKSRLEKLVGKTTVDRMIGDTSNHTFKSGNLEVLKSYFGVIKGAYLMITG